MVFPATTAGRLLFYHCYVAVNFHHSTNRVMAGIRHPVTHLSLALKVFAHRESSIPACISRPLQIAILCVLALLHDFDHTDVVSFD